MKISIILFLFLFVTPIIGPRHNKRKNVTVDQHGDSSGTETSNPDNTGPSDPTSHGGSSLYNFGNIQFPPHINDPSSNPSQQGSWQLTQDHFLPSNVMDTPSVAEQHNYDEAIIKMLKKYNDWIQSCRIYNKYNYITVDDEGKNFICEACKLVKTKQFIGNVIKFEFVNNRAKERINEHLATDYHATSISYIQENNQVNEIESIIEQKHSTKLFREKFPECSYQNIGEPGIAPEATKEDNIIRQLKRISGWIAKDKDNVKYKYITLDDDGKNFICEACKFVNENFNGKDIKFEFDAYDKNRNTKSSIYNHLTTNKGHAAVIKTINENNQMNYVYNNIKEKYDNYKTIINEKYPSTPEFSNIILNRRGRSRQGRGESSSHHKGKGKGQMEDQSEDSTDSN
ncbi:hypothetical protein ACQ4LE_011226 [Meloidogyne hapla]